MLFLFAQGSEVRLPDKIAGYDEILASSLCVREWRQEDSHTGNDRLRS